MARIAQRRQHLIQALYDNPVGRIVTIGAVTAVAAASLLTALPRSRPIDVNIPAIGRSASSDLQASGQTVTDIYYAQARSAILQDVPGMANYQSALDYTARKVGDLKKFGFDTEQIRQPMAAWLQANIDWDIKGERLVPLNYQNLDFMPVALFQPNTTFDLATNKSISGSAADAFGKNTSLLIESHAQIWENVQNPEYVDNYLIKLEGLRTYEGVNATFPAYAKAIRTKGTDTDKKHWALYMQGREDAGHLQSGEEIRKYAALTRILAVGGKAAIEVWGFVPSELIKRSDGHMVIAQHGDLAVYESPELEKEFASDPEKYGTPLNRGGYLGIMPNEEGVEYQGTSGTQPKIAVMWLDNFTQKSDNTYRRFFYGNEQTAIKYGHD